MKQSGRRIWSIFIGKFRVQEEYMVLKFIHSTRASLWFSLTCLRWADHFKHQSELSGFSHSSTRKPFPPGFLFFTQWNIHLNNLVSLWLDLNSLTCFSLLDTVKTIGQECMLCMPNHRASPRSLPANGRKKMVSVISLSLREGGEHAARTVGANMLSSGLYNIQSVYVWDNLWSQIKSVARREERRAGLRSSPQQDQHSPYTVQTSS